MGTLFIVTLHWRWLLNLQAKQKGSFVGRPLEVNHLQVSGLSSLTWKLKQMWKTPNGTIRNILNGQWNSLIVFRFFVICSRFLFDEMGHCAFHLRQSLFSENQISAKYPPSWERESEMECLHNASCYSKRLCDFPWFLFFVFFLPFGTLDCLTDYLFPFSYHIQFMKIQGHISGSSQNSMEI